MKPLATAVAAILATLSLGAHAVGSLADVAVYDRSTHRELPVHWHEGKPYVVGNPGNEYQVVIRNPRGEDLLAITSVDGVNVLSGQTASTAQGGYIVAPWGRVDIRGWRKSLGEIASFYFTSLGDSYAGRTGRPSNVGVIGVAFFRRARPEPAPPAVDSSVPFEWGGQPRADSRNEGAQAPGARAKRAEAPSAPLGTGHGRREESHVRYTDFDRATREPAETITIYYDSHRNLVARGVLTPYAGARTPQAFPSGFVPDPPR